jgi:hypothetical protein
MLVNVVHVEVRIRSLISITCMGKAWHLFKPTFIFIPYTASTTIAITTQLDVRFEVPCAMTEEYIFFGCDTM